MEKGQTFLQMELKQLDTQRPKKPILDLNSYKNLLKIDYRYKCKTIKLLEENIGGSLCDPWLGKEFLDMTPKR